jgi:rubrerythrin
MKGKTEIEILKNAILLERQGKAFYETVAKETKSPAAKKIFALMAREEEKHVGYLSEHYKNVMEKGFFISQASYDNPETFSNSVLSGEIKNEINAASYEAAAISAAIEMEKKAIALYSGRAAETDGENEKALYTMLTEWEKTHLDFLAQLNKELTEEIWYENSFWPF